MPARTAVFTIISLNYGAFARTLMESLQAAHPDWDRYVLIVDRSQSPADIGGPFFSSVMVEELPLPRKKQFLFRYGVMELNTAVKPWMFARLRGQGYGHVIYLDPDILVLEKLVDIERLLETGASGVLLPHLTAPIDDGRHPAELDIMRAGAYNLGFLALGDTPATAAFLDWWKDKLEFGAVSDVERGLFTDQKWMDLVPGMFEGFAILRDPGYDVAYWNLSHRPIARSGQKWMAAGSRLRFFHFSGFDPENPQKFSKHQNRFELDTIGPARELALEYAARVMKHDHAQLRTHRYAFGSFDEGTPIPEAIRVLYREDNILRKKAGDDPFASASLFLFGEVRGLPLVLSAVWLHHRNLQSVFPDPLGSSRLSFYSWFVESGAVELGISRAFVEPVRRALVAYLTSEGMNLGDATRALAAGAMWRRLLVGFHKRVTGRNPSMARLLEYSDVSGPVELVRLGVNQFQKTRWARKLGLPEPVRSGRNRALQPLGSGRARTERSPARWIKSSQSQQYWGLFDEPGQDAWWMGPRAQFMVDPSSGTMLRLRGIHPAEMHRRAHDTPDVNILITIDEEPRGSIALSGSGAFDASIDIGVLPSNRPAVLGLIPDASIVPRDIGFGADGRTLSVQITSIELGETTVFSAAHPPAPSAPALLGPPGVNVIGYALSEHGVGQSLRLFVAALDAAGVASSVVDFNEGNLSRTGDRSLEDRLVPEPAYGINVFHVNADQMPVAELHLASHVLERFNIGFWHWELPDMLDEHLAGFRRLNEVWVPTAFVQDAVSKKSPIPVVRMPHAIRFSPSPGASRARFNLPADRFLFLMMYDFSSVQERKNPAAALEAFDRGFGRDGARATLVVKTQNADHHASDLAALKQRLAGRRDVVWINETLSRQAVYDLYAVCDALVSLHRSEGFGLGPAEAMFLGKPVIATNWSGNTDFMRQDNSLPVNFRLVRIERSVGVYRAGQTWAEPDVEHAAWLMRRVMDDNAFREQISREAIRTMRDEYSPEVAGRRIRARLEYVQSMLDDR